MTLSYCECEMLAVPEARLTSPVEQEKAEWKAAKLAQKLDITLPVLRKRISVWLAAGAVTISQSATGRGAQLDVTYKRCGLDG